MHIIHRLKIFSAAWSGPWRDWGFEKMLTDEHVGVSGHWVFHLSNGEYLSVWRQELCPGSVNYRFISGCFFWLTLGRIISELASSAYGGVSCLHQIKFGCLPTSCVVCIQRRRKHAIPCFCFYFFWLRSFYGVLLELYNPHCSLLCDRA